MQLLDTTKVWHASAAFWFVNGHGVGIGGTGQSSTPKKAPNLVRPELGVGPNSVHKIGG